MSGDEANLRSDGDTRPLPERGEETVVIRHEERADVGKRWRGIGFLRAKRQVEVVPVDETFAVEVEQLAREHVPASDHDSGQIETLPDGSISIPIYEEQLVVTRRTVLKERVIIRKEIVSERTRVEAELRREHVELAAESETGTPIDVVGELEER